MLRVTHGAPAAFAFMTALLFSLAASVAGQVQKVGGLSFAVPEGWKYEHQPNADYANIVWTNGSGVFCIILVTRPVQSSGDIDADFAAAWRGVVERNPSAVLPTPLYEIRGMVGYPGKYSGGSIDNRTKEVRLYVLEAGPSFVPVVVLAPSRAVIDALEEVVRAVVGSIRVAPLVALPFKTTVNLADLVGDWKFGDASVVSYVNTTTGSHAGTSTTYVGEFYTIAPDGRYAYSLQGMTDSKVVREQSAGVVEFSGEFIVFHELPNGKLTRYRFIAYEYGLNGGTLLTLLPEAYSVNPSNIALYASRFARAPLGK